MPPFPCWGWFLEEPFLQLNANTVNRFNTTDTLPSCLLDDLLRNLFLVWENQK